MRRCVARDYFLHLSPAMARKKCPSPIPEHICLERPEDVRFWIRVLHVESADDLRFAMSEVGRRAAHVREFLEGRRRV